MLTKLGHLTYCTNIHVGESWSAHFEALKFNFPLIKKEMSPLNPMGIGLRLSNEASVDLREGKNLLEFKNWLAAEGAYVFTMNGFPYGEFHHTVVKDDVHSPDWTSEKRVSYTLRLVDILAELLPEGMDGGISTSPLSYRHWFQTAEDKQHAMKLATENILKVVVKMNKLKMRTSQIIHLDIEPEPDGLLETGAEFIEWYNEFLIPMGLEYFNRELGLAAGEAVRIVKRHVRLCYDICHFALGYEDHASVIKKLAIEDIKIGKFQVSAALKAKIPRNDGERQLIAAAFAEFDEPTYLHQVIAQNTDGSLTRYRDLPAALEAMNAESVNEWRAHFHVPIFEQNYGLLESTQADIIEVLDIHREKNLSPHLEVETYTWGVLPTELKIAMHRSIIRELDWVWGIINK